MFPAWPLWRNGDQLSNHGQTIPGLGDCTAVAVASAIRVLTGNRGGEIALTDDQVVGIYEANRLRSGAARLRPGGGRARRAEPVVRIAAMRSGGRRPTC